MKVKRSIFIIVIVIATITLLEVSLRMLGYRPGIFRKTSGFVTVDSLILYRNFTTDEAGIYKFSSWVVDSLSLYYNPYTGEIDNPMVKSNLSHSDRIEDVYRQFSELSNGNKPHSLKYRVRQWIDKEEWDSEFLKVYRKIQINQTHDDWEKAVLSYGQHPFNQDGFRGIEFKKYPTKRKKVLIVGDSFVYGLSAKPFFNSFSDILLARGYLIYTAGIPGTDPSQYAAIAKKYATSLQPDLVVFCFFSGNDMMPFYRDARANEPHEYMTNAGFFESSPLGRFLSLHEAYDFYLSLITIPKTSVLNNLFAKSSITTMMWGLFYDRGWVKHPAIQTFNEIQRAHMDSISVVTKKYIDEAVDTCHNLKIPYVYTVIPDRYYNSKTRLRFFTVDTTLLDRTFGARGNYYYPQNIEDKDYNKNNDTHFNNSGSTKFANFLDSLIQKKIEN